MRQFKKGDRVVCIFTPAFPTIAPNKIGTVIDFDNLGVRVKFDESIQGRRDWWVNHDWLKMHKTSILKEILDKTA